LKPGGKFIIGFIDKNSPVGKSYQRHKKKSKFYRIASFYSAAEVASNLNEAGFQNLEFTQTIFRPLSEIKNLEPVKKGYGEGSFIVVKSKRPKTA
jgi:hypothetical protein